MLPSQDSVCGEQNWAACVHSQCLFGSSQRLRRWALDHTVAGSNITLVLYGWCAHIAPGTTTNTRAGRYGEEVSRYTQLIQLIVTFAQSCFKWRPIELGWPKKWQMSAVKAKWECIAGVRWVWVVRKDGIHFMKWSFEVEYSVARAGGRTCLMSVWLDWVTCAVKFGRQTDLFDPHLYSSYLQADWTVALLHGI